LCQFYVKREKINAAYKDSQSNAVNETNTQQALEDYSSRFENKRNYGSSSRNRSFSSFLSQQEAYTGFDSFNLGNQNNKSFAGLAKPANMTRGSHNNSVHSLSSFCTVNELEKSMSYVEKTAKKLLPILTEVKKRMIPDKKRVK